MKYYVTVDFEENPVFRTDDLKEAKVLAEDLVKDETHLESRVYTEGTNDFTPFYNPFLKRKKGVILMRNRQREICVFMKAEKNYEKSAFYNYDRNTLYIARKLIVEHPRFEDLAKFETYVYRYYEKNNK